MNYFNGIKLDYSNGQRNNYMSDVDLFQDLTTDCLLKILPSLKKFDSQMSIMREVEKRNELDESVYFDLLETCNGI